MRPTVDDQDKLKLRNFRMSDVDWGLLEAHFQERRIPVATGVRMVLIEYMREKGVLL
ncbi:MAG: hypothetical protein JZU65_07305 [Chlorobium sp.]|nr:hypothetical protein [Chlorobium sp.]